MTNCPVCETSDVVINDITVTQCCEYTCARCGNYVVTYAARDKIISQDIKARSLISHKLRRWQGSLMIPITPDYIEKILKNAKLPNVAERANALILYVGDNQPSPGMYHKIEPDIQNKLYAYLGIEIGESQSADLVFIIKGLMKQEIFETPTHFDYRYPQLTFEGWQKYEELKRSTKDSRKAFFAMAFPKEGQDNYLQDDLFPNHLKPAVAQAGYELSNPLLHDTKAGNIVARMEVEIRSSRFVVADLSDHNNGAYWEAGFARGLGLPVIYLCDVKVLEEVKNGGTNLHFDVRSDTYVKWDKDNPKDAATQLKALIRATLFGEAKMTDD